MTQEDVAQRIEMSPDSVQAWERGTRLPPPEVLDKLAECLEAPYIPLLYMRDRIPALRGIIPDFRVLRPLPEAVAEYISCMLDLVDTRFDRKLLRMVADGEIDDLEAPVWFEIMQESAKTHRAYLEMMFASGARK